MSTGKSSYKTAQARPGSIRTEPPRTVLQRANAKHFALRCNHLRSQQIAVRSREAVLNMVRSVGTGQICQYTSSGSDGRGWVCQSTFSQLGIELDMAHTGFDYRISVRLVYLKYSVHALQVNYNRTITIWISVRQCAGHKWDKAKIMLIAQLYYFHHFFGGSRQHDKVCTMIFKGIFRRFGAVASKNIFLIADIAFSDYSSKFLINMLCYSHCPPSSHRHCARSTHKSTHFGPLSPSSVSLQKGHAETIVSAPVAAASRRRSSRVNAASSESVSLDGAPQQNPHSLLRTISRSVMPGIASRSFLGAS